ERLWFLDKLLRSSDLQSASAYHIPLLLRIQGALDVERLEFAFHKVIQRHESLRTRFVENEDLIEQVVDNNTAWHLHKIDATQFDQQTLEQHLKTLAQAPFDLSKDVLLRVSLLSLAKSSNDYVLLVLMHHIVSDAWSIEILINEVLLLYKNSETR